MATADRTPTACGVLRTVAAALLLTLSAPSIAQTRYGIGRAATPAEVAAWNIDVEPDGRNFPPGRAPAAPRVSRPPRWRSRN